MPPKYKRRGLAVRYKDCGRFHETSSEVSWNSSTVVDCFLAEQGRKKGSDRFKKYDAPDCVHFNEWVRSLKKTSSPPAKGPTVSKSSKMEKHRWYPRIEATSPGRLYSSKFQGRTKSRTSQELRDRRPSNKKVWNMTTEITWKENMPKREQFRYILDGRRLPNWRNENYKNVKSQYLKPRKQYDQIPLFAKIQPKRVRRRKRKCPVLPPPKEEKVFSPLNFPLAIQCVCEKEIPVAEPLCPVVCPVECSFVKLLPGCSPLEVASGGEASCCVNLPSSDYGSQDNQSASRPCSPMVSCGGIGSQGYSLFSRKLNCASSPVQHDAARQSSPGRAPGKNVVSTSRSATPTKTYSPSDSPKVSDGGKTYTAGLMNPINSAEHRTAARGIGRFVLKASDNLCNPAGDSDCLRIALSEGPVNLTKLESWAKELAESSNQCCVRNVEPYVHRVEDGCTDCLGFACIGTHTDSRERESGANEVADNSESSPRWWVRNSKEAAETSHQRCVPSFEPHGRKLEDGCTACTGFAGGGSPTDSWEGESRLTTDSEVSENLTICNFGDPCRCIGFGCFGGKR